MTFGVDSATASSELPLPTVLSFDWLSVMCVCWAGGRGARLGGGGTVTNRRIELACLSMTWYISDDRKSRE